jgi:RimJ/RimL family protein N-acetyltransferase
MTAERRIDVHPLRPGEETLWLSVSAAPDEITLKRPSFTDLVGGEERRDRRCHLIAVADGRAVGRLTGTFLNPRLYFVHELQSTRPGAFAEVAAAFGRYLAASFGADGIEVLSWDRPDLADMNAAFRGAGFRVGRRKVFVERDLTDYGPPMDDPFTYVALPDVGESAFVEVMTRAAEGDPFEDAATRDPVTDFRELVEYAGETFDPRWWRIAELGGRTAGVVLPQRFPGPRSEGTLFYVGIVPSRRGRGLGKRLHAAGLSFLSSAGVVRYIGSTDDRNVPMLRIFEANRCRRTGVQIFLNPKVSRAGDVSP